MNKLWSSVMTVLTLGAAIALSIPFGDIPPLGDLLSPSTGFWRNAAPRKPPGERTETVPGLRAPVSVQYDSDMVPHVFAGNDHDLYFAQGLTTARDRLWQMDMLVRTASGTLAEVLGPGVLDQDRYYRSIGLQRIADETMDTLSKDPLQMEALQAYTDGVNAYINSLSQASLPLEYKLFSYSPRPWKPSNCILVFKLMSATLTIGTDDISMTTTLKHFGATAMDDLFPQRPLLDDPVIPGGTPWTFKPLPQPLPSTRQLAMMRDSGELHPYPDGIGSNNWAVTGSKTRQGFPMLANDPHLTLSLPSIWYQVQLVCGKQNVYGVSIPGMPYIIIGFNRNIAWGLTNAEADATDWYLTRFKDAGRREYLSPDGWREVNRRPEHYAVHGAAAVDDTVLYAGECPVVYQNAANTAKNMRLDTTGYTGVYLKWTGQMPAEDLKTFYLLDRAGSYEDYRDAMRYLTCPAQNVIFADNSGNIAITVAGRYPVRYKDQGKFVLYGPDKAESWQDRVPPDQVPASKNPAQGFLASANQTLTDISYPYYLGGNFSSGERACRINSRLREMSHITVDSLRLLQDDAFSILAQQALPVMLACLDSAGSATTDSLPIRLLRQWDLCFTSSSAGATIFNAWWGQFYNAIWSDEFDGGNIMYRWPSRDRTLKLLLQEPNSKWFDDIRTPARETCRELVVSSFHKALEMLKGSYGPSARDWRWGRCRKAMLPHMAGLGAFSLPLLTADGAPNTINALSKSSGPSWRMVVQLGPQVKGYGILPGGESGNPGSFYYDNMFGAWQEGRLNQLCFLAAEGQPGKDILTTIYLKK